MRKNDAERLRGMTMFAEDLVGTGRVRPGHDVGTVAGVLWLAMDIHNYDWLVRHRGWTAEEYQRWYVDSVAGVILDDGQQQTPKKR